MNIIAQSCCVYTYGNLSIMTTQGTKINDGSLSRAVAHGPAGQAMAGPVFGESCLIFFPLRLANVASLTLQRDSLLIGHLNT